MDFTGRINSIFVGLCSFECIEINVLDYLKKDEKGYPTLVKCKYLIVGKDGEIYLSDKRVTQIDWLKEHSENIKKNKCGLCKYGKQMSTSFPCKVCGTYSSFDQFEPK